MHVRRLQSKYKYVYRGQELELKKLTEYQV